MGMILLSRSMGLHSPYFSKVTTPEGTLPVATEEGLANVNQWDALDRGEKFSILNTRRNLRTGAVSHNLLVLLLFTGLT